jgi:hypothetical protein
MKVKLLWIFIFVMIFIISGCNLLSKDGSKNLPIEVYKITGTVMEKPTEEYLLIATSILTDQVKVNPVLWQQLQPGDTVEVAITKDTIISAQLPGDKTMIVSYMGPGYDTVGNVTDKFEDLKGFGLNVGGKDVSGTLYVEETTWDTVNAGDEVIIYYNLQGITGVSPN